MNLENLIIYLIMLLIFIISIFIIIILKCKASKRKEENQNNYNNYLYNEHSQKNMYADNHNTNNNDFKTNHSKKTKVIISAIIVTVVGVMIIASVIITFGYVMKYKLPDSKEQSFTSRDDYEDKEIPNVSLNGTSYLDEDYEKLINDIIKSLNIKDEVLIDNIHVSLDDEDYNKISYITFDFIKIKNNKYKNFSVSYKYNEKGTKKVFFYDHSYSSEYDFEKRMRKEYMTIKDGCSLFKKFLNVININGRSADISFKADKYTSTDDIYEENHDHQINKYYLVDFDNSKVEVMPENYKECTYGIYSVVTVTKYNKDTCIEEKYVYEY